MRIHHNTHSYVGKRSNKTIIHLLKMLWLLKIINCHSFQGTYLTLLDNEKEIFTSYEKFHCRSRKISQFVNVRANITIKNKYEFYEVLFSKGVDVVNNIVQDHFLFKKNIYIYPLTYICLQNSDSMFTGNLPNSL